MKRRSLLIFMLVGLCSLLRAQVLNFPVTQQEQPNWCWVASSQSILSYYSHSINQCDIANYGLSRTDCCPTSFGVCDQIGYLLSNNNNTTPISDLLDHFGSITTHGYLRPLTIAEIQMQILNEQPFIFELQWTGGGAHFMVGYGIIGNTIFYLEPETGTLRTADYNWLLNGIDGALPPHQWIQSLTTVNYNISICTDASEPNDNGSIAKVVFPTPLYGFADISLTGTLGHPADEDWYRVDLNAPGNLQINLTDLPLNGDLYLYADAAGTIDLDPHGNNNLNLPEHVHYYNSSNSPVSIYVKVVAANPNDYWLHSCYSLEFIYTPSSTCSLTGLSSYLFSPGTGTQSGAQITTLTPSLNWNTILGATNYGVYVTDLSLGSLVVNNDCATSSNSYAIPSGILSDGHQYKWTVVASGACSSSCSSSYSDPLYFQVQLPGNCSIQGQRPNLISPGGLTNTQSQIINIVVPTLKWNKVSGATNYGVYIRDLNSGLLVLNNDCATIDTIFAVPSDILSNGGLYRWNIIATNGCNSTCTSYFASDLYFQVQMNLGNCEYWLDSNYSAKISGSTSGQSATSLNTNLVLPPASPGVHDFHIRFLQNDSLWSSVVSSLIVISPTPQVDTVRKAVSYEYWLDSNYATRISNIISPQVQLNINSSFTLPPTSPGIHSLHLRAKDNAEYYSAVVSQIIDVLPTTPPSDTIKITEYDYWFDNNYGAVQLVPVSNQQSYILLGSLSLPGLSSGMHSIHLRFLQNNGLYSSVVSQLITVLPTAPPSDTIKITEYDYWFDNNYGSVQTVPVTNQQSYILLGNLSLPGLSSGIHSIHLRFLQSNGLYSSVVSQLINVLPTAPPSDTIKITEYDYWFDNNYGTLQTVPVTSQPSFVLLSNLNSSNLSMGVHTIQLRFLQSNGLYSSVISSSFFKIGNTFVNPNLITAYRYWFDTTASLMTTVLTGTSINAYNLAANIYAGGLTTGLHTIHFQFKDLGDLWSEVTNDTFSSIANPIAKFTANDTILCNSGLVTFTNNSLNASSYLWYFGDGDTSTFTNPIHTYASGGPYTVLLIAINSQNVEDTLVRQRYIRVNVPTVNNLPNTYFCQGSVYRFNGTTYTHAGTYPDTLRNAGVNGCDSIVILNLVNADTFLTTVIDTIFTGDSVVFLGHSYTQTGVYADTLVSTYHCDSILSMDLLVIPFDSTLFLSSHTIHAPQYGDSYQWITCPSGQPIAGADSQTYTPTHSGSYACIITIGASHDTTGCYNFIANGISEPVSSFTVHLYPNPTKGIINLSIETSNNAIATVNITDDLGQKIDNEAYSIPGNFTTRFDLSFLSSGVYYFKITIGQQSQLYKVVNVK